MTKFNTTQKAAKNSNDIVLAVPYCFLQHALNYESPVSGNSGVYGWNFDVYDINDTYSIVTGYRGIDRASTHDLSDYPELRAALKELDQQSVGRTMHKDDRKQKLIELLDKYLSA